MDNKLLGSGVLFLGNIFIKTTKAFHKNNMQSLKIMNMALMGYYRWNEECLLVGFGVSQTNELNPFGEKEVGKTQCPFCSVMSKNAAEWPVRDALERGPRLWRTSI